MQTEEKMLRAEIDFWHFMIENRNANVSEQATERMFRACELAERRLMMVEGTISSAETRQTTGDRRWN